MSKTNDELYDVLRQNGDYDFIYLSSHGNSEGFGSEDRTIDYSWSDFGALLCDSMCMREDCIIMLSCCRGGLHQVAYSLFYNCRSISYIVGPRQSLFSHDMLISFSILLYNLEHRGVDPVIACDKIRHATDIRFICFDRLETECQIDFQSFVERQEATT